MSHGTSKYGKLVTTWKLSVREGLQGWDMNLILL